MKELSKPLITRKGDVDLTGAQWRKSSLSTPNGSNCVEVAFVKNLIAVRDTKNPNTAVLLFTKEEWKAFLGGVQKGEFEPNAKPTL